MHPYLLEIMAQQHAEDLRRKAAHSRLSSEIPRKHTGVPAARIARWLSFWFRETAAGGHARTSTYMSHSINARRCAGWEQRALPISPGKTLAALKSRLLLLPSISQRADGDRCPCTNKSDVIGGRDVNNNRYH